LPEAPEPEPNLVVLVAEQSLRLGMRATVEEACASARVECVTWQPERALPPGRPALVISALEVGERRISDSLVALMTRAHPGLPLLLLCTDELIRPTVSLQDGRVTLLGPQLTVERIAARVRILLAEQRADSTATLPFGLQSQPRCLVHEQSSRQAYYAFATVGGPDARPEAFVPVIELGPHGGVTAVLNVGAALTPAHLARVHDTLDGDESTAEKESALADIMGPAALVHLSASNEWLVHWPLPTAGLILASPLRLPRLWSFSDSLGRTDATLVHAQGATADVLFALWGVSWPAEAGPARKAQLLDAALAGGPRVLDFLVEQLQHLEHPAVGLVMEVR
jgi:hypothetical protein